MTRQPLLRMQHVRKVFPVASGTREILKGVDFEQYPEDFTIITGPSGSGKTTLLNLAALLSLPSSGAIEFEGNLIQPSSARLARTLRKTKIGMIFQQFHLLPRRSVLENVLFRFRYLSPKTAALRQAATGVLEELGLDHVQHQPARLLSGGEMQRVAIARALIHPPRLVVADEPTGNLDRETADTVMRALQTLHAKGIAILLVTHNTTLLEFGTRHLVCDEGTLREEQTR